MELPRYVASPDFLVAVLCILSGGRERVRVGSSYARIADGSLRQGTGRGRSEFDWRRCTVGRQDRRRLPARPHLCSTARDAFFWRVGSWNSFAFGGQRGEDCPGRCVPGRGRNGSRGRHHCLLDEPLFWLTCAWHCLWIWFRQLCVWRSVGRVAYGRRLRLNSFLYGAASGILHRHGPSCRAYDPAWAL